ncbi:MAG: phage virion morphogenesis protein [Methylomarinum sp.]|nr:phage virion morphogenesis protein [Methylomarinum sp.]
MIEIEFDSQTVLNALQNLQQASSDLEPALVEIGEMLTESTKQRFESASSPNGNAWPSNSKVTTSRKPGNKPLIGETGLLMDTINYQLVGDNTLEVGSPMEYAAMQQFGGNKSEFPWLWGDIPARPFLGVSDEDEKEILDIVHDHLQLALK